MTARETAKKLRAERESLKDRLRLLASEITAAEAQAAKEEFGVEPGVIVVGTGWHAGIGPLRVTKVDTELGGKPWVEGVGKKKGGEWSKRVTCLYNDWELAEKKGDADGN